MFECRSSPQVEEYGDRYHDVERVPILQRELLTLELLRHEITVDPFPPEVGIENPFLESRVVGSPRCIDEAAPFATHRQHLTVTVCTTSPRQGAGDKSTATCRITIGPPTPDDTAIAPTVTSR